MPSIKDNQEEIKNNIERVYAINFVSVYPPNAKQELGNLVENYKFTSTGNFEILITLKTTEIIVINQIEQSKTLNNADINFDELFILLRPLFRNYRP